VAVFDRPGMGVESQCLHFDAAAAAAAAISRHQPYPDNCVCSFHNVGWMISIQVFGDHVTS